MINENEISNLLKPLTDNMVEIMSAYIELYENTIPKKIYRNVGFRKHRKRRYLIVYNPIHDMMISPIIPLKFLKGVLKNKYGRI